MALTAASGTTNTVETCYCSAGLRLSCSSSSAHCHYVSELWHRYTVACFATVSVSYYIALTDNWLNLSLQQSCSTVTSHANELCQLLMLMSCCTTRAHMPCSHSISSDAAALNGSGRRSSGRRSSSISAAADDVVAALTAATAQAQALMVEDAEGAAVATAAATAVAGTGSSSSGSTSSSGSGAAAATQLFYVSQLLQSRQREQARTQALARFVIVCNEQLFALAVCVCVHDVVLACVWVARCSLQA
jgi:hypothetical protein